MQVHGRNNRAERQERTWHVQVTTRSQCDSGRREEKVDIGSNAGGPIGRQGLCLSFRVGNNFRELWAEGSIWLYCTIGRPQECKSKREPGLRIPSALLVREEGATGQSGRGSSSGEEVYTLDVLKAETGRTAGETGQLRAQEFRLPAPMSCDSQLPVTPAMGNLKPSSGLLRHCSHMRIPIHIYIIKI